MNIKQQINTFLEINQITVTEIARRTNTTQQNMWRILKGPGKVSLEFVVWLANEFPEIDLEMLFRNKREPTLDCFDQIDTKSAIRKQEALKEIEGILDKYIFL